MAGNEFSFIIDWSIWIPIGISMIALALTIRQIRKDTGRNRMADTEKSIDRAYKALKDCETNYQRCGHEKDELRRENVELYKQVASMAKSSE